MKQRVAKGAKASPVVGLAPLQPAPPIKRARGRPRKNPMELPAEGCASLSVKADVKTLTKDMDAKALTVFRKAMADAEKALMTPEDFDGGGTAENAHSVSKESLQRRVTRRLNVLDRFLTDDKLIELLSFSSLKEIGIYEGIMLDKSLVLQGQPTVIIGNDDRNAMASVLPRLMDELKRRKLIGHTPINVNVVDAA